MKQDIKFNVWVLFSSIIQVLAGLACLGFGALAAVMGMLNTDKLLKIKEISFFIKQKWLLTLQSKLFGGELLNKYLFLFVGILIAVIGIIILILAIVELVHVKRYSVVNHRAKLIIFALIPLIIAGCVEAYLLLQHDVLKSNIQYIKNIRMICFGICGVFSVCAIFKLLGVLLSKSEEFVSNDNSKYAFEAVKGTATQPSSQSIPAPAQNNSAMARNIQNPSQRPQGPQPQGYPRPSAPRPTQGQMVRPNQGQMPARPVASRPNNMMQSAPQGVRPNPAARPVGNPQIARPAQMQGATQQMQRPNGAMPQRSNPPRPMPGQMAPNPANRPNPMQVRRCSKCGKVLLPNEKICSACGYKPNN